MPDPRSRRRQIQHRPSEPVARDGYVAVGRVRGPHGVAGELKIEPLTDAPDRFRAGGVVYLAGAARTIRGARSQKDLLLVKLEGVDTKEAAGRLRGALLEVPEADLAGLEEGRFYRFQVVGLEVVDAVGERLGYVEEILETGANDVYIVRNEDEELLIPAIDSVVRDVDVPGGRMIVEVLPGMERRPLIRSRGRR